MCFAMACGLPADLGIQSEALPEVTRPGVEVVSVMYMYIYVHVLRFCFLQNLVGFISRYFDFLFSMQTCGFSTSKWSFQATCVNV